MHFSACFLFRLFPAFLRRLTPGWSSLHQLVVSLRTITKPRGSCHKYFNPNHLPPPIGVSSCLLSLPTANMWKPHTYLSATSTWHSLGTSGVTWLSETDCFFSCTCASLGAPQLRDQVVASICLIKLHTGASWILTFLCHGGVCVFNTFQMHSLFVTPAPMALAHLASLPPCLHF